MKGTTRNHAIPKTLNPAAVVIAPCAGGITHQSLAQATPGYNNKIPEKVMMPDNMETVSAENLDDTRSNITGSFSLLLILRD